MRFLRRGFTLALLSITACSAGEEAVNKPLDGAADDATARADSAVSLDVSSDRTSASDGASDGANSDASGGDSVSSGGDGGGALEICNNGLDDDADGSIDEQCPCTPNTTQMCYPGRASEAGVGPCTFGTQRCTGGEEFGAWGACAGASVGRPEVCADGVDQDCNGTPDDGPTCVCARGAMERCYTGRTGTVDVGICRAGSRTCDPGGGAWGSCLDEVLPRAEICGNNLDDDCDGMTDNVAGCVCTAGAMRSCYPGPMAEIGRGVCRAGTQRCAASGTSYTACAGAVGPSAEVCANRLDDDCDGMVDEGCTSCIDAGATPWQQYLDTRVYCFGRDLDEDPREFDYASVPAERDSRWSGRSVLTIDFSDPSTIPGRFCDGGHTGGVFTYFQTFFTLTTPLPASVTVAIDGVDDGTQLRVYNSRYPGGYSERGWVRFDAGSSTNLAAALVAGRNRLVLVHIDDNPTTRSLRNVRILFNGRALVACP